MPSAPPPLPSCASSSRTATILLTGASGFVGSELMPELQRSGQLRCFVRDAGRLGDAGSASVHVGDLTEVDSLRSALTGTDAVYYLVHSMEPGGDTSYVERDRLAAQTYTDVARECGVRRTTYLGGIAGGDDNSSEHLVSRREVEDVLSTAGPEFVALRASMIVGARSASFGTLARIVDRLPVLAMPTWRDRRTQPIAVADVVAALVTAQTVEPGTYDIAGPDTLSFQEMTEIIAGIMGRRHRSFALPFSNAKLEGVAAALITGEDSELLEPLMAGMHGDLTTRSNALATVFAVTPTPFAEAARAAIDLMPDVGPTTEA
nr:NAD(P)H-binding protein [Paraconexibacter antarcticus]